MNIAEEISKLAELAERGIISQQEFETRKAKLLGGSEVLADGVSPHKFTTIALFAFFLGGLGVHRFMVGKTGSGIAMALTCGGLGIWSIIDFVMILTGKFTDAQGRIIKNNS